MPVDKSFKGNSRRRRDLGEHRADSIFSDAGSMPGSETTDPDKFIITEDQRDQTTALSRDLLINENILNFFAPRHAQRTNTVARAEPPHQPRKRRMVQVEAGPFRRKFFKIFRLRGNLDP